MAATAGARRQLRAAAMSGACDEPLARVPEVGGLDGIGGVGRRADGAQAQKVTAAGIRKALVELMFAGKHKQPTRAVLEAASAGLSVLLELIEQGQSEGVLEPGDPGRVGLLLLATVQGIATMVNGGIVGAAGSDELVADAIAHFVRGSRCAA